MILLAIFGRVELLKEKCMQGFMKNFRQWFLIVAAGIAVGAVMDVDGCGKKDEGKARVSVLPR
jgi:hypothetical protein